MFFGAQELTGARAVVGTAGEVLLGDVPAYIWHDGCAPTSLGMILGYYDGHGFPELIPGPGSRTGGPAVSLSYD